MSDERLREAERRWRQTGLPEDEAALLREQVRAGRLASSRVALAGFLRPSDGPGLLAEHFDSRFLQLHLRRLVDLSMPCGREAWARVGLAVVRRALPLWLRQVPETHEPERVLPFRLFAGVRTWVLTGQVGTVPDDADATHELRERNMSHPGGHENHAPVGALAALVYLARLVTVDENQVRDGPATLIWNTLVDGSLTQGLRHEVKDGQFRTDTDTLAGHHMVMFAVAEEVVPWLLDKGDPVRAERYLEIEGAPR